MKLGEPTIEKDPFSHFFNESAFLSLSLRDKFAFIQHLSTLLLKGKQDYRVDSMVWHPESALGQELGKHKATYISGDKLFDESFSIDSVEGLEFLGECGLTFSKVDGDEEVLGFEAWLFDKKDIRTQTLLLIPEGKLSAGDAKTKKLVKQKNLPVSELIPGGIYTIESEKLRLQLQVIELETIDGKVGKLSVEMTSYKKL